jgi:hypothetical protein
MPRTPKDYTGLASERVLSLYYLCAQNMGKNKRPSQDDIGEMEELRAEILKRMKAGNDQV